MRTKFLLRYFSTVALLLFAVASVKAQNLNFEEIKVVAPYEPTISDAFKIQHNPGIPDTIIPARNLEFNILPRLISTRFEVEPLTPARMRGEPLTKLYRGFAKAGLGTGVMPYGEAWFSNLRSNSYMYNVRAKHLSSASNVYGFGHSAFSDNLFEANGRKFFEKTALSGGAFYERNVVHYYGFQRDSLTLKPLLLQYIDGLTNKDIRQRYQTVGANMAFGTTHIDSSKVMYNANVNYAFSNNLKLPSLADVDPGNSREHQYGLTGRLGVQLPPDPFGFAENQYFSTELKTQFYNHRAPYDSMAYNTGIISLVPQISSQYKDFRFTVGLNATFELDTVSHLRFYPVAYVEANLINKVLVAYGGITGFVSRNSFRDITSHNPFVNETIQLGFSNTRTQLTGGFKGSVSSFVAYNFQLINTVVDNFLFFEIDTASVLQNKFTTLYDDVRIFQLRGEISTQIRERFNLRFCADYYQFSMKNEIEAWHRPPLELTVGLMYNMQDKIIIRADAFARNSSFGKTYDALGNVVAKKIHGFHVDTNIGLEYRYTRKLGIFLNLYNVQNQPYYRWLNYPTHKFNFLGGVSYSF